MPSPELLSERITVLFHKQSSRHAFNIFHYVWDEVLRGTVYENMYMVCVCVELQNLQRNCNFRDGHQSCLSTNHYTMVFFHSAMQVSTALRCLVRINFLFIQFF